MSSIPANAFQDALERARAVAAKLSQSQSQTNKRPLEEEESVNPEPKRSAAASVDPFGAQLAAMKQSPAPVFKPNLCYLNGIIVNGEKTLDMMVPGTKVGYIIGKGGDMIRNLQERACVKMTVIQSTSEVTEQQKQLRIVGEPSKVDYARQLVNDLLTEKELEVMKLKNKSKEAAVTNEYGSTRPGTVEVPVPPQFIGLVIGRGGENIKRIQQETMTKIQFDTTKSDAKGNKVCSISGQQEAVNRAADMVREIIDNANNHGKNKQRPQQQQQQQQHPDGEEIRITVPQNKTGIVIGRGGETIRAIKQQSGCLIELEKNSKGVFIIRGPPDRIPLAQQLINERIQGTSIVNDHNQHSTPYGEHSQPQQQPPQQQQQPYWSQPNYWQQETTQSPNETAAQNSNAAAWAAYYAQLFQAQQQQQSQMPNMAVAAPNGTDQQQVALQQQPQAAQPQQDYSAQWIEYYRAYGMHEEAEAIEQMAKSLKQQQTGEPLADHKQQQHQPPPPQQPQHPERAPNPMPVAYPGYNYAAYSGLTEKQ